jgi:hypothetical protein
LKDNHVYKSYLIVTTGATKRDYRQSAYTLKGQEPCSFLQIKSLMDLVAALSLHARWVSRNLPKFPGYGAEFAKSSYAFLPLGLPISAIVINAKQHVSPCNTSLPGAVLEHQSRAQHSPTRRKLWRTGKFGVSISCNQDHLPACQRYVRITDC